MIDRVEDGILIVSYAERKKNRICVIPSFDGGKTWDNEHIVTIIDNAAYCDPETGDFGYPAMVDIGDSYLSIYYAFPGRKSEHRGIYGNYVPKSSFKLT